MSLRTTPQDTRQNARENSRPILYQTCHTPLFYPSLLFATNTGSLYYPTATCSSQHANTTLMIGQRRRGRSLPSIPISSSSQTERPTYLSSAPLEKVENATYQIRLLKGDEKHSSTTLPSSTALMNCTQVTNTNTRMNDTRGVRGNSVPSFFSSQFPTLEPKLHHDSKSLAACPVF